MKTVLLVLATLALLALAKKISKPVVLRGARWWFIKYRVCTAGGGKCEREATHLVSSEAEPLGMPVCLLCVRKECRAPIEWLISKGWLTAIAHKDSEDG